MISIIVPVYKAEKTIRKCVDSILRQSLRDFELILVNNASPDRCPEILHKYAAKDSRIKVIDIEVNCGPEGARRAGLDIVKGDYFMHVDSDDWLAHKDVLKEMHEAAESTGADIVECGVYSVIDRLGLIRKKRHCRVKGVIEQPELHDKYWISYFGENSLAMNIWGKLFRRETVERANIQPMGYTMCEDQAYNMQLFPFLKKICILDKPGYCYRYGGLTSKFNPYMLPDLTRFYLYREERLGKESTPMSHDCLRIEMKNVLRSSIAQMIEHKTGSHQEIIEEITRLIHDPAYAHILELDGFPEVHQQPFVKAWKAGDAEGVYNECEAMVRSSRLKNSIKRFIYRLIG